MKATFGKKPPKDAVIARFREFKGDKFEDTEIGDTYGRLEAAGLFD